MMRFGTCSWKYDSWRGLVYSDDKNINYLKEYSAQFNMVEIDQWFWSLFPASKVKLPDKKVVEEYAESVPEDFLFTIKVPNSLTLTHFYNRNKNASLIENPYFLSNELFDEFLETLNPLKDKIGCLMFQFEYLNKQKMNSLSKFETAFRNFHSNISAGSPPIAIEIRNPNYLKESFFEFLQSLKLYFVFLEGYYMPSIIDTYSKFQNFIKDLTIIRLHGPDRKGIEKLAKDDWSRIIVNRDDKIKAIAEMIAELNSREVDMFINVNNHFEGSAPLTIKKIKDKFQLSNNI